MKVSPKDMPKVLILCLLIVGTLIFISMTLMNHSKEVAQEKAPPAAPDITAGQGTRVSSLEPNPANPQQYLEQLQEWSNPPTAPMGNPDPFREVLPRDIMMSLRSQHDNRGGMPRPQISGNGTFGPGTGAFDPTQALPDVRIDFPTVMVQGVIVDNSSGAPENFATILVDNQQKFAKAGDPIGNDLVVEKVTLRGVQIRAAKEHAFIEISKSYKPNGMAPPAPPSARRSRRHR
jgi:hypothetical protein